MRQVLVRYKTKPEATAENERLIRAVFEELRQVTPDGIRYTSMKLEDGVFVHLAVVEGDGNPLPEMPAFKAFQADIQDRCVEPPHVQDVTLIGQYRVWN